MRRLKMMPLLLAVALLCGCGHVAGVAEEKPQIVATNFVCYDFAREIAGEFADVTLLIDPGTEVHAYEPSPADILKMETADLFVYIGGESDVWAEKLLSSFDDRKTRLCVRMMESVEDPYTFYYTPAEMTEQEEDSQGVYHGIGMVVTLREGGGVEIVRVYEDSPEVRAGLMTGDIIVAVDGESIAGDSAKDLNSVVSLIKGLDGTDVTLTVLREGAEMQITATRGVVNLEYAQFEILEGHIGYITISQFTGNAVDGVKRAVDALKAAKVDGVIVDVRDDPGGMLDEVVEIADLFLPECMIVYMEDRAGTRTNFYSDSKYWDVPMVVLVNGGSASASEIFAAAIKENERGIIVGETTFGKGIVQTLMTFSQDGAGMQYTSASYFTPDGNSIHGIGVEPDLVVQPDETGEDAQLQAAIDALKGEE